MNSIGGSVTVPNTDTSREQHFKRKGEVGDTTQNELASAQNTRDIYGSGCLRKLKHGYQHWSLGLLNSKVRKALINCRVDPGIDQVALGAPKWSQEDPNAVLRKVPGPRKEPRSVAKVPQWEL